MDTLHNHLAPGAIPLVGRMFEAAAAQQLAGVRAGSALPFVGAVLACRSGASITVERRLTLDEDLFLADHNFVDAASVKPLADCFPVVPMTVSLEIMAETAACLAPGYGLTGFDDVVARRWIAVVDGGALALRVAGRVLEHDTARQTARIAVQVYAGDVRAPAIEASLSFGAEYAAEPPPQTCAVYACEQLDAARLYGQRHLFHGGRFQRLHGTVRVGPEGACAELRVLPAQDWFASQPSPQMLLDPALLDTVGQLIAVWSMQQGSAAFPIGLGRLDLFGPTPAPGTLVPASIRITGRQLKMLSADVEIGDGAGGVWLRISGWKSWQFNWARQLTAFQRQPSHFLLSDRHHLPAAPAGTVCQRLAAARVADFDLALLARHCLHPSEMAAFGAKATLPRRQQEWLLGRIVAKDAARAWSARGGAPFIHPASFAIENDGAGQPRVAAWPAALPRPCLTISHSNGHAIALASASPAGIDIEQIAVCDDHFLATFSSAAERQLLAAWSGRQRDAWITRLWCAKEAFGKRLGTGVDGAPQQFEALAVAHDGSVQLRHRPSGVAAQVYTVRDGDFMIAVDSPADPTLT
jgi:4'-phosphopantetheinyl transferase EntD